MSGPKLLDLFCGAGGMSLGAARAGFTLHAGIDFDSKALSAHALNFPGSKHLLLDLSQANGTELLELLGTTVGEIDVIVGGPPCQGFSTIGRRDPGDKRNELIGHFFRIIADLRPKAFLMENVPGVLNSNYSDLLKNAMGPILEGYTVLSPRKLRAVEAGAPTIRQRVLIVGFRNDCVLRSTDFWNRIEQRYVTAPTVRQALDGLPLDIPCEIKTVRDKFRKVRISREGPFFERASGRVPAGVGDPAALKNYFEKNLVSGCTGTVHSNEVALRYGLLKYGETDSKTKSMRLNPNGYCPTLRAGTGPEKGSFQAVRPIHYLRPRVITPREAARLQGFPDWYQFDSTKWHAFRQIGNSVSPHVSELVLTEIKSTLGL